MGRRVCLGFFVLATIAVASCDSDDPLKTGAQDGVLRILANGAKVKQYYTWRVVEVPAVGPVTAANAMDINGDGVVNDADKTLWCRALPATSPGSPTSVPWTFAVKVSVLRAGTNQTELLTSALATSNDQYSRAPYDDQEPSHLEAIAGSIPVTHSRGECTGNSAIRCNPNTTHSSCETYAAGSCIAVHTCTIDPIGGERRCEPTNPGGTCQAMGAGVCTANNTCSSDPLIACDPTCGELGLGSCELETISRKFLYDATTRVQRTAANRTLLDVTGNLVYDTCNGDAACTMQVNVGLGGAPPDPALGFCPGDPVGEPGIDPGNPITDAEGLHFNLDPGDTLIVEASRSNATPGGGQVITFITPPSIRARLFLAGAEITPQEVTSGSLTPVDPETPTIGFTYTSQ